MRYLSVCSGIEAASVAWAPLGWEAAAVAEIDPFACAVLAHRFPNVPNLGDFTKIGPDDVGRIDLLVGGTPCQDFSVAGLRNGLAGDRGALTIEFLRLAGRLRPEWLVWENVPGVLSADDGRAFGIFLGGLAKLGYGFAYRVLDAQYFGVPQRRRRVFVVGYLGDWRRAAAVLFERASLSRDPAPRRQAGKVAPTIPARSSAGGGLGTDFDCDGGLIEGFTPAAHGGFAERDHAVLRANAGGASGGTETLVAHILKADGFDASEDGTGRDVPLVAFNPNRGQNSAAVAFQTSQSGTRTAETHATLDANNGSRRHNGVAAGSAVRRLTPRECERLMGMPDDYTLVPYRGKPAADGPRYRALGNSMARPVMEWIGRRIQMVARQESGIL